MNSSDLTNSKYFLQPGDKVHIIAPSGRGKECDLEKIAKYVESLKLVPYINPQIYSPDDPFYANTDKFRANDLFDALTDDSKLIWCIRGGSGAMRLIPYLEESLPDKLPQKLFVGYSDITVLHTYLQNKYDWSTIQGPMLGQIVNGFYDHSDGSVDQLIDLAFDKVDNISLTGLKKISHNIDLDSQGLSAKVVGGNLTLVESSIGTNWQINTEGKILFLEDIHTYPYSLERSLDHMKQAHIFESAKGVIFGDFIGNSSDVKLFSFVEQRFADSIDVPVFTIGGIGHGKVNHPLPLNTEATITPSGEGSYNFTVNNVFCNYPLDTVLL